MAIKEQLDQFIENVIEENIEDIIGEKFGNYSKYIIQDRALPDVRDGLKPVQRRILYAMHMLKMGHDKPYKKSARIAGEVMGKYHPHGDTSIYEAMVRMSQKWKMRTTLIDMHGNNGSIDGDPAAAMRYTEARLSLAAEKILQDIEKRTIDFIPNFDDAEYEPVVLPCKFPNILVNGAMGISSGYATNIPPHNLKEVVNATIALIERPKMTVDELLNYIQGPDFPTGGIVQGLEGIKSAFETGRGNIIIRSKTEFEKMVNEQYRIIIHEIPYEINKAKLVEAIDRVRIEKNVDDILEVRDESDKDGLRIAIDLKKEANKEVILNFLFKNTDLQKSYSYNIVAINQNRPVLMGILDVLEAYIEHQKDVITNRTNFELMRAEKRLHIVLGLIKMISIIEEVIETIRKSANKANSKENLIKLFDFTDIQAEAIVTLQLYRLSSTDILALKQERDEVEEKIQSLKHILSNEKALLTIIKNELKEVAKVLGTERKTLLEENIEVLKFDEKDLISREQVMVALTKDGYIKRSNLRSFQSTKATTLKENDTIFFLKEVSTLDTLLIFTNLGNFLYLPVHKLEDIKYKDLGTHIGNIIKIAPNERVIDCLVIDNFDKQRNIVLATKNGLLKQCRLSDYNVNRYSKTINTMSLDEEDELVSVDITTNPLEIVILTKKVKCLRIRASEINLYGLQAGGVKSVKLDDLDSVVKVLYTHQLNDLILLTSRGHIKRLKITDLTLSRRSRGSFAIIKEIKGNPHFLVDAANLSHAQYQEDVKVLISCRNENQEITAKELKYLQTDSGKQMIDLEKNGLPLYIFIDSATDMSHLVDGSYLIEEKKSIMSELEDILYVENRITDEHQNKSLKIEVETYSPVIKKTKKEKEEKIPLHYKQSTLFDLE